MNRSEKCEGSVTRVNRKNTNEQSAIDFLVVSKEAEEGIDKLTIDEKGEFLLRDSAASDHNSFLVDLSLQNVDISRKESAVRWRLNAPTEKWIKFKNELALRSADCQRVIANGDMHSDYIKWKYITEKTALKNIRKTTIKFGPRRNEISAVLSNQ